jgi:hypothetical protein
LYWEVPGLGDQLYFQDTYLKHFVYAVPLFRKREKIRLKTPPVWRELS